MIDAARLRLDKRRREIWRESAERVAGQDLGETLSEAAIGRAELVPLDRIEEDPEFQNLRLPPTDEEVTERAESMRREGLKVPVILISDARGDRLYVRAGFRRVRAARLLGWSQIPAIVLPADTPRSDEYWTNVIENAARSKLSSYEVAVAAKFMRDEFKVSAAEFGIRAGYSESYVGNLLRCVDHLPPEIIAEWRGRAPIPVDTLIQWSALRPEEAVVALQTYRGRNPAIAKNWQTARDLSKGLRPVGRRKALKVMTSAGLRRAQRLRFAAEVAGKLSERERKLCTAVVDYCAGARDDVPEIYDGRRIRTYKSRSDGTVVALDDPDEVLVAPDEGDKKY